jgi:sortilin
MYILFFISFGTVFAQHYTSTNKRPVNVIHDFFSLQSESSLNKIYGNKIQTSKSNDDASLSDSVCRDYRLDKPKLFSHSFDFDRKNEDMIFIVTEDDDRVILLVTTKYGFTDKLRNVMIYSSDQNGELFHRQNYNNNNTEELKYITDVFQSPYNRDSIIISCKTIRDKLYFLSTINGGKSWRLSKSPFKQNTVFKTNKFNNLLTKSTLNDGLWWSLDFGINWLFIENNTNSYEWNNKVLFFTKISGFHERNRISVFDLYRIADNQQMVKIMSKIYSFGVTIRYLYTSKANAVNDSREVLTSTDLGDTWQNVQLPVLTPERFYSVVDVTENGKVFMHVANSGDHGDLYVSDNNGIKFRKSLQNHLYSGNEKLTDFYKVASLAGTFITTRFKRNGQTESVITFNDGLKWNEVKARCEEGLCNLQLHNMYSIKNGAKALKPLSLPTVPGVILAHGHYGSHILNGKSDVFISTDGGYSWSKALNGSHFYKIIDYGSMIVALPFGSRSIKYSTDLGGCWYKTNKQHFPIESLTATSKSLLMYFWGLDVETKTFKITSANFQSVLKVKCNQSDFESLNSDRYCLNGLKPVFKRHVKGTVCYNGKDYRGYLKKNICECERNDFVCDYGFINNENNCIFDSNFTKSTHLFQLLCSNGYSSKIVTNGYRKRVDTKCKGGFTPNSSIDHSLIETNCRLYLSQIKPEITTNLKSNSSNSTISSSNQQRDSQKSTRKTTNYFKIFIPIAVLIIFASVVLFWCFKNHGEKKEFKFIKLKSLHKQTYINASDTDDPDNNIRIFNQGRIVFGNEGKNISLN